jgi:hypothetical protein
MLDRALGAVAIPANPKGNWRDRLTALLGSYLRVLYDGSGLAQLALTIIPTGPNALRLFEALLDLLLEGGIHPTVAAWAVDLLTLHVVAVAAEQSVHRDQNFTLGPVYQAINAASAKDYPRVHALREEMLSGEDLQSDGHERFNWGIDVLINGILNAPAIPGIRPPVNPNEKAESGP